MSDDPISVELWTWNSVFRKWLKSQAVVEPDEMDFDSWIYETLQDEVESEISTDGVGVVMTTPIRLGDTRHGYALVYSVTLTYDEENYDTGNYHPKKAKAAAILNVGLPAGKFAALRKTIKNLVKSGGFGLGRGRN